MVHKIFAASVIAGVLCLFAPIHASAQIAPGVLQSAAQTATITGSVMASNGAPVPDATVQLRGPGASLTTKSDQHGTFSFTSIPYGTYRIAVSSENLGTVTRDTVVVRGDIGVAIQYLPKNASAGLKEIARVTTRSAGAQINVTPASIASITPSEAAFQGNWSWQHLLNQIPGVSVNGDLQGGYQVTDVIAGSPVQPVVISINGALPYETAVTLDGMPLQNVTQTTGPGAGFDISALPISTFDTADIVRGPGANAPSIVNSIGGSFVLHAPSRIEKNSFEFSASNDPYGGIVANAKVAMRFGHLSALVTYGVNDSPGPYGTLNVYTVTPTAPLTIDGKAFNGCTSGVVSGNCFGFTYCANYQAQVCHYQDQLLYCCISNPTGWSQHTGAISLAYDLTPAITAQVFYAGSSYQVPHDDFGLYGATFAPGSSYGGSLSPGTYMGPQFLVQAPYDFYQTSSLLEEKIVAHVGRGVVQLAALQNNSWSSLNSWTNTEYPNGQYTLYGTGYYASAPTTPVAFNGTVADLTFPVCAEMFDQRVNNRDFVVNYATQVGSTSDAGISFVSSYYNNPSQLFLGFGSYSIADDVSSANSETTDEIRLHAGTTISNNLTLNASWYFARGSYHIQNPGANVLFDGIPLSSPGPWNTSTFPYSAPRIGVTWQTSRDIIIRGAAGGGYALPPISYLQGSTPIVTSCPGDVCSLSQANLNLKPETSFGFDLGTDVRFHHDTVLSFDLYRTNLYGQFFTTTTTSSYSGSACTGPPCVLYTTQYNNLQQSRYEGITLNLQHDVPHGIYWHGTLGLTRSYVVSVPAGFYNNQGCPTTACTNVYIIPGANFNGVNAAGLPAVPYSTATFEMGYRWSPRKYVDIAPIYFGNNNPYFEPAFVEVDAHAGYPLTKNVSILASFRNITNIYGYAYQRWSVPSMGAPSLPGNLPYPLLGIPYGPRSVIVTLNAQL